jgi:3-deoxy-7-phosphoheptulonate synthase
MITPQHCRPDRGAIGARTTSQVHRCPASGLSCPVGFRTAPMAMCTSPSTIAVRTSLPVCYQGAIRRSCIRPATRTATSSCGGKATNYDAASVNATQCARARQPRGARDDRLLANSQKRHEQQVDVARDIAGQIAGGDARIFGVMIESHLNPGRQDLIPGQPLQYGVSITDACIGWDATENVLRELADAVRARRVILTDEA